MLTPSIKDILEKDSDWTIVNLDPDFRFIEACIYKPYLPNQTAQKVPLSSNMTALCQIAHRMGASYGRNELREEIRNLFEGE